MSRQTCLVDLLGYEIFLLPFTFALLLLPYFLVWYICGCVLCYFLYKLCFYLWVTYAKESVQGQGRGVLITGCDSGFGFMFARRLDDLGFNVFAGCLSEKDPGAKLLSKTSSKRLHVIHLDVTQDKHVTDVVTYIKKHLPKKGLWGVVNNAGINMAGFVELATVDMFNKCLNVNFYGAVRVIKETLPLIRHSKGRIVNISSVHGIMTMPRQSMYQVSKHAIETYSDSLRLEMMKFGVNVSIVQPGCFAHATSVASETQAERQKAQFALMWEAASEAVKKAYKLDTFCPKVKGCWPPDEVAGRPVINAVQDALCSPCPRTRYLVWGEWKGYHIHLTSTLFNYVPTWIMDRYVTWWSSQY